MCGRFNNYINDMKALSALVAGWPGSMTLSYNIAPTTQVPVVSAKGIIGARWGLIPSWAKEFSSRYPTHNARIETVAEKATFKNAWHRSQTCIVPAAGYYEWRTENGIKRPYYIHQPDNILAFAGLWERWGDRHSFTILTEDSHGDLLDIHHRMPLMLTQEMAKDWLNGSGTNMRLTSDIYNKLELYPVSTQVNSPKNQQAEIIEPTQSQKNE